MRIPHFRGLLAAQVFGCVLLLWWLCRPQPRGLDATSAPSGIAPRVQSSTSASRSGAAQQRSAEPAAEETSSRAADETRALIFGASQAARQVRLAPEPPQPPTPPEGGSLPLVFGRVPDHVDIGAVGAERLRQLQEGFIRSVSARVGESPAANRQRWDRAVRLADAQLWPVFGQEVANAFANGRQRAP